MPRQLQNILFIKKKWNNIHSSKPIDNPLLICTSIYSNWLRSNVDGNAFPEQIEIAISCCEIENRTDYHAMLQYRRLKWKIPPGTIWMDSIENCLSNGPSPINMHMEKKKKKGKLHSSSEKHRIHTPLPRNKSVEN